MMQIKKLKIRSVLAVKRARDDILEPKINIEHLLNDLFFGTDNDFLGLKEKRRKEENSKGKLVQLYVKK